MKSKRYIYNSSQIRDFLLTEIGPMREERYLKLWCENNGLSYVMVVNVLQNRNISTGMIIKKILTVLNYDVLVSKEIYFTIKTVGKDLLKIGKAGEYSYAETLRFLQGYFNIEKQNRNLKEWCSENEISYTILLIMINQNVDRPFPDLVEKILLKLGYKVSKRKDNLFSIQPDLRSTR